MFKKRALHYVQHQSHTRYQDDHLSRRRILDWDVNDPLDKIQSCYPCLHSDTNSVDLPLKNILFS